MPDRFSALVESLITTLLTVKATLPGDVRAAIFNRASTPVGASPSAGDVPEDLRAYVDKVARNAYKVTDSDVEKLKANGYSEDQLFEATLSAAAGAAWTRLERGLNALHGGT